MTQMLKVKELLKYSTFYNEKQMKFYSQYFQTLVDLNSCFHCCLRFAGKSACSTGAIENPIPATVLENFDIVSPYENNEKEGNICQQPRRRKPHPFQDALPVEEVVVFDLVDVDVEKDANGVIRDDNTNDNLAEMNEAVSVQDNAPNAPPCPTCLGLLQIDMDKLSSHLHKQFTKKAYNLENHTFKLSLRLPFQLPIRHAGMIHHLHDSFHQDPLYAQIQAIEVKEVLKSFLKSRFSKVSGLSFNGTSPFSLSLHFQHPESEKDYKFLQDIPSAKFQVKVSRKRGKTYYQGASAEKITRAVSLVSAADFKKAGQAPPPPINSLPSLSQESSLFEHASLYIAGRYCKLKRHISNSAWVIGGKRMTEDSMEELIGNFLPPVFGNEGYKFSSAGREDSDVLMLNDGRPFYFEVLHPKISSVGKEAMRALEEKINASVEGKIRVFDLQMVSLEDTSVLKNSAATKSKSYMCLVELENPVSMETINKLSGQKNLLLAQRNPTRVPRRADMVREKTIEEIILHPQDQNEQGLYKRIMVDLQTSAGTYVKEFMHGDEGRTVPCLSSILECGAVSVISLDVSRVHLEWPDRISSAPFILQHAAPVALQETIDTSIIDKQDEN